MKETKSTQDMQLLSELGTGLVHKMGNTLGPIPVLVAQIERNIDPEDVKILRKLHQIRDGVIDALAYVNNFRSILEFQSLNLAQQDTDLKMVINSAIQQTQHLIMQNAVDIKMEMDAVPLVRANGALLTEAFRNLIMNAVEAMPNGGTLTIRCIYEREHDNVRIWVSDTGVGIPYANINNLFHLGFSTKEDGQGIGLWFSKIVFEQHGGTLLLEKTTETGTTFVIQIPTSATDFDNTLNSERNEEN